MKKVVETVFGSHLYGMETENSDTDYKGIVLPTKEQVLLQQANFHTSESTGSGVVKNSCEDVDKEYFSLHRFIELACKGETVAIDMLHGSNDKVVEKLPLWDYIVENRSKFYTKSMKAYIGYVKKQAAKYGVKGSKIAVLEEVINLAKTVDNGTGSRTVELLLSKLPIGEHSTIVESEHRSSGVQTFYELCGRKYQITLKLPMFIFQLEKVYDSYGERAKLAKENKGVDWKAVSHALRAGYQAKYIYSEGGFTYPLPETEYLVKVKRGELDYLTQVQPVLEALVEEVIELSGSSDYPERVNRKFWNDFIIDVHEAIVTGKLKV